MRVLQRIIAHGLVLQPGWIARQLVVHNPTTRQILVRVGGTDIPSSSSADLVVPAYTTQSVPVEADTFTFAVSTPTILSIIPEAVATATLYEEPVPSSFGSVSQISYPTELLSAPGFPREIIIEWYSPGAYVDISIPGAAAARVVWSTTASGGYYDTMIPSVTLMPALGGAVMFMVSGQSGTFIMPLDASGNGRLWIGNPYRGDNFFSQLNVTLHASASALAVSEPVVSRSLAFTYIAGAAQQAYVRMPLIGMRARLLVRGPHRGSSYVWRLGVDTRSFFMLPPNWFPPFLLSTYARSRTHEVRARPDGGGSYIVWEEFEVPALHGAAVVFVDASPGIVDFVEVIMVAEKQE